MLYCSIDTCSLINLAQDENTDNLSFLNYWQENEVIKFVFSEVVIEEWENKKYNIIQGLKKNINTKKRNAQEFLKNSDLEIPPHFKDEYFKKIEQRFQTLDKFLLHSEKLETSEYVKSQVPDRLLIQPNGKRKAPFHNKLDSVKDCYIIFSCLDYLKNNNINNFLFISHNHTDFASSINSDRKIHEDIDNEFPNIEINYYKEISRAVHELKKEYPLAQNELSTNSLSSENSLFIINKTEPILNQLYSYLNQRFKEIQILPAYIFKNDYPFNDGDHYIPYRKDFTLKVSNEKLYELFKLFKIDNRRLLNTFNNEEDYNKALFILQVLNSNHIFNIQSYKSNEIINIEIIHDHSEDSILDSFEKFQFSEVFSSLPNLKNDNLKDNIKIGYFYYKIGDLIKSKDYFLKALEICKYSDDEISKIICYHNLHHLGKFIKSRYWDLEDKEKITSELLKFNPQNIEVSDKNRTIKKLFTQLSFFTNPQNNIQIYTNEVVEKYYFYLRNGTSSSNFNWDILYEYATLHSFLKKNCVIYDEYLEYQKINENLIHSVFASYSIKFGKKKIHSLNNYFIHHIISYSDPKSILKYYKRFHLNKIDYMNDLNDEYDIISLFSNFINNDSTYLKIISSSFPNQTNQQFQSKYDNYFINLLVISSILKLERKEIKIITNGLLKFITKNNLLKDLGRYHTYYNYIYGYFINQIELISSNSLKQFLLISFKNDTFYSDIHNHKICNALSKQNRIINFTAKQFSDVVIPFIERRVKKDESSYFKNNLIYLSPILNDNLKSTFKKLHINILNKKFNHKIYVSLVIYNLIDLGFKDYFNKYIKSISISEKERSEKHFYKKIDFNRYDKIDDLLNICFKHNISLEDIRFKRFKNLNPYYKWIFNVDSYDYKKFNPYWIDEYSTKYYYSHFAKSKILKEKIKEILEKDFDIKLHNIYCRIYTYH